MNNSNAVRNRVTALVIVVVLVIVGVIIWRHPSAKATVHVSYNLSSLPAGDVHINSAVIKPSAQSQQTLTYRVAPGAYTVEVKVPGCKTLTARFDIAKNEEVLVNASLALNSDPTIHNLGQVIGLVGANLNLSGVRYYYSQTWAVMTVRSPGGDKAAVVAAYSPPDAAWYVRLGPGTSFTTSDISGLPSMVQTALRSGGYVSGEGLQ